MRVLLVNWVDHRDPAGRGGGVRVYQRNLVAALARHPGVQVATLAAGLAHDVRPGPPRIEPLKPGHGDAISRYQLVNSGVLAPAHADFGNPAQLEHPPTEAALDAFLRRTGPWDAIQFDNLEGLPARALAVAAAQPGTRVLLSLHNYYPICPQVNLWQDEARPCTDFRGGAACATCLPAHPNRGVLRMAYATEWLTARMGSGPGTWAGDRVVRPAMALGWRAIRRARHLRGQDHAPAPVPDDEPGAFFAARRAEMVRLINAHCHRVLCVSDRVRQIALAHGLDPARTVTSYIGTDQAQAWARTAARPEFLAPDGTLRLAYLGYMRADKGFGFLMEALTAVPPDQARRVHLLVAARPGAPDMVGALDRLRPRLASVTHRPGYAHAELDDLLAGVDLGVVPVLWEDNLPQVAIEMHARHIPLLCSDRGGARELGQCDALVFRAGDAGDFARALAGVLDGQVQPADYFRTARAPLDMDSHARAMLAHYAG